MNTSLIKIDGTLVKLIGLMDQKEITPTKLQTLLESGLLADLFECKNPKQVDRIQFRNILDAVLHDGTELEYSEFSYPVDYSTPPIKTVESVGYDIRDLAAMYLSIHTPPMEGSEITNVNFSLVRVLKHISRVGLEKELLSRGLRPPNVYEMLAFDKNYNGRRRNSGEKTSSLSSSAVFVRDCGMEYLITISTKKNLVYPMGERYGEIGFAQIPRQKSMEEDMYLRMLLFVKIET